MEEQLTVKEAAQEVHVRQRDESECGVACLASVIRYYGGEVPRARLWELSGASRQGTSLLGLHQAAQGVGLEAGAYKADLENLKGLDAPCILHITKREGGEHYVVCYGFERRRFILGDPAASVQEYSPTKLKKVWQSRALLTLTPTAGFKEKMARENGSSSMSYAVADKPLGDAPAERYRCLADTPTPFGQHQVAIRSPLTETVSVLPSAWAQLLLSLDRFDTLEGHATTCLRKMTGSAPAERTPPPSFGAQPTDEEGREPEEMRARVAERLAQFVEEGLLASEADLRSEIRALAGPPTENGGTSQGAITSVGIPTRDRTGCLRRGLASYIENIQHHGRTTNFVVVDDASSAETQEQNRRVLRKLKKRYGANLFYAHRQQRAHFAERLAGQADIPQEVVRFALLGDERCEATYGATRNALLLHTAGERCLQVDDDTICAVAAAPGAQAGLALTSNPEVPESWFFGEAGEALDAVSFTDEDFLSVHEAFLGKPLHRCINAHTEGDLHVDDFDAHFLRNMQVPEARVAVSFAGAVGDSGMRTNVPRVFSRDATYERLVDTAQTYQTNVNTRHLLRAASRPSITNGASCMTMNIGLDNRSLLPPFMPVGRNEDGIFGAALRMCFQQAYRAYLPYVVRHAPPERRSHNAHEIRFEFFNANDILVRLMLSTEGWPRTDGAPALQALGRYLKDIGALSRAAFVDFAGGVCRQAVGHQVSHVQRLLAEDRVAPAYWVEDVQRFLATAQEAVTQENLCVPVDLEGNPHERLALLQDLISQFGALLICWPTLVEAARELRDRGQLLATAA